MLNFWVYYNVGPEQEVRLGEACDLSQIDVSTVGLTRLECSYEGYDFVVNIAVIDSAAERKLLGIISEHKPEFYVGEITDVTEAAYRFPLQLIYTNGESEHKSLNELVENIEEFFAAVDFNTVGNYTVNGSYEGVEFTLTMEVKEAPSQTIVINGKDISSVWAQQGKPVKAIEITDQSGDEHNMKCALNIVFDDGTVLENLSGTMLPVEGNEMQMLLVVEADGISETFLLIATENGDITFENYKEA